ncbi:MAG: peptide chain release factor 2 [Pseudomonadota bacterium]
MSTEIKQSIIALSRKLEDLKEYLDLPVKEKRLQEIERLMAKDGFWDHPEDSAAILKERTAITNSAGTFKTLTAELEEHELMLEMAEEEQDTATADEVGRQIADFEKRLNRLHLELTLNGPDDGNNAIISINAGAGGTEAQDWAEMLMRMYLRWIERHQYSSQIIDYQPGEEAGIKSTTITVTGDNAYGFLKTENGVHRLVRISPFNASGKRHTSFASVFVYPEVDKEINIEVEDKDLRIDVFRASGAGGQHVNKTSSAVRITHMPSGIVVQCQQEKSQHRNKDMAMKVLKARLYREEQRKQEAEMQKLHDGKDDIAWGNQIRSYVLQPYQMVKDHRIGLDIGNVNAVLDGNIDPFIEGVLLAKKH